MGGLALVVGEGGFELAEVGAGGFEIGGEADEAVAGGVLDGAGFPSFDAGDTDLEAGGELLLGEAEVFAGGTDLRGGQQSVGDTVGVGQGDVEGSGLSFIEADVTAGVADERLDLNNELLTAQGARHRGEFRCEFSFRALKTLHAN